MNLEKGTKSVNLEIFGVLRHDVGIPCNNISPRQGVACPCCGTVERRLGQALGLLRLSEGLCHSIAVLRRGVATVHRYVFLSRFVIPLFRELVYWTNEGFISV